MLAELDLSGCPEYPDTAVLARLIQLSVRTKRESSTKAADLHRPQRHSPALKQSESLSKHHCTDPHPSTGECRRCLRVLCRRSGIYRRRVSTPRNLEALFPRIRCSSCGLTWHRRNRRLRRSGEYLPV